MLCFIFFAYLIYGVDSAVKSRDCATLKCNINVTVCAIRTEGKGFMLRTFRDECDFLHYNCAAKDDLVYNATSMFYCLQTFQSQTTEELTIDDPCEKFDCLHPTENIQVCGLRQDGPGYRISLFKNKCEISKYNCKNNLNFTVTDFYICDALKPVTTKKINLNTIMDQFKNNEVTEKSLMQLTQNNKSRVRNQNENKNSGIIVNEPNNEKQIADNDFYTSSSNNSDNDDFTNIDYDDPDMRKNYSINSYFVKRSVKTIPTVNKENKSNRRKYDRGTNEEVFNTTVVIPGMIEDWSRINETINNFFEATHYFDLPIRELPGDSTEFDKETRRMKINVVRPIKLFVPETIIPNNVSDDREHVPLLAACLHKCPTKCPDNYAPVCGRPGRFVRDPNIIFLNHCYMDKAQCELYYERLSLVATATVYMEASFIFCLGDSLSAAYKFLPLLRTLQRMGRLPKKGRYRHKFRSFKIFNNFLNFKNPNLQG